jgi:hypothetical protein
MGKGLPVIAALALTLVLSGCGTMDYTAPLAGKFDNAGVVTKRFTVIGAVSVQSTETHSASPLGFVKKVEGSKITYTDLMLEAARIDADDIIDVRIDMNTSGKTSFVDFLKGWERTFIHTGQALAIKYSGDAEADDESLYPGLFR